MIVVGGSLVWGEGGPPLSTEVLYPTGSDGWKLITGQSQLKHQYVGTKLITMDNIIYMIGMSLCYLSRLRNEKGCDWQVIGHATQMSLITLTIGHLRFYMVHVGPLRFTVFTIGHFSLTTYR